MSNVLARPAGGEVNTDEENKSHRIAENAQNVFYIFSNVKRSTPPSPPLT
jgi:hypothetical protein